MQLYGYEVNDLRLNYVHGSEADGFVVAESFAQAEKAANYRLSKFNKREVEKSADHCPAVLTGLVLVQDDIA